MKSKRSLISFVAVCFLIYAPVGYSDKDDDDKKSKMELTITEAFVIFHDLDNNGIPDGDESLIVRGHKLCEINNTQILTLGTTKSIDILPILNCTPGVDPDRDLDEIEAVLPIGLNPATYRLLINNSGKSSKSSKDKDVVDFDFTYGSVGLQGEQGIQGDQGIQGPKGDKGDTGDQGIAGIQGDQGPMGDQGLKGDQGIQGPKGDKGDTGDQGIGGVQGPTGTPGANGATGEQGPTGPMGLQGPSAPRFYGGLLSLAHDFEDCIVNELGFNCQKNTNINIAVPMGMQVLLEAVRITTIQVGGEPVPLEETIEIELLNRAKMDGPGNEIVVNLRKDTLYHEFTLATEDPFYRVDQPGGGLRLWAALVTEAQVVITMNLESIKEVNSESLGIIVAANIIPESYTPGGVDARASVTIQNYGDLKTDYLIIIKDFTPSIEEQVVPQALLREPLEIGTLVFDLHSQDGFDQGDSFFVKLKSPTGRIYDEVKVFFP